MAGFVKKAVTTTTIHKRRIHHELHTSLHNGTQQARNPSSTGGKCERLASCNLQRKTLGDMVSRASWSVLKASGRNLCRLAVHLPQLSRLPTL